MCERKDKEEVEERTLTGGVHREEIVPLQILLTSQLRTIGHNRLLSGIHQFREVDRTGANATSK